MRLPGFQKLSVNERWETLARELDLSVRDLEPLMADASLPIASANAMIENAVGVMGLPVGLALNFRINGRDRLIPLAVEEASVVAACSLAAKIARGAGGFDAEADPPVMIGQIQIARIENIEAGRAALIASKAELLALADSFHPQLAERGGGARDLEVRVLDPGEGRPLELVVHLLVDTRDAMGANLINTMVEGIAPRVAILARGRVGLKILSNLADHRLARARCRIPAEALSCFGRSGEEVARGIEAASRFAEQDPYRACTHNKGVMNGVDALAIATGNDWRAIEAGAHAFAARSGRYSPLSTWRFVDGALVGQIELPIQVGTVGGAVRGNPLAKFLLTKVLRCPDARDLAAVMAAVGLAQNLAALRALATVGIQEGHMALHARAVAHAAGATGGAVERLAEALIACGEIKLSRAEALLREMT